MTKPHDTLIFLDIVLKTQQSRGFYLIKGIISLSLFLFKPTVSENLNIKLISIMDRNVLVVSSGNCDVNYVAVLRV